MPACSTAESFALGGCSAAGDQGRSSHEGSSERDPQEGGGSRVYDGAVRRPRYVHTQICAIVDRRVRSCIFSLCASVYACLARPNTRAVRGGSLGVRFRCSRRLGRLCTQAINRLSIRGQCCRDSCATSTKHSLLSRSVSWKMVDTAETHRCACETIV